MSDSDVGNCIATMSSVAAVVAGRNYSVAMVSVAAAEVATAAVAMVEAVVPATSMNVIHDELNKLYCSGNDISNTTQYT